MIIGVGLPLILIQRTRTIARPRHGTPLPVIPRSLRRHRKQRRVLGGSVLDGRPTEASTNPLSPGDAWSRIEDWLSAEPAWIPEPTLRHADLLSRLVVDGDLRGNLIPDAHLAALALEHGVGVCSADSDFARFPQLSWVNPVNPIR